MKMMTTENPIRNRNGEGEVSQRVSPTAAATERLPRQQNPSWAPRESVRGRDLSAAERTRLIEEHLPLVRHIVGRLAIYLPHFMCREELVSAGIVGLIEAIDRFEPDRNCSLKTYCTLRVRGAVLDEFRRMNWAPRSVQRDSRQLSAAQERLAQRFGREPSEDEIREEMGLTPEQFEELMERVKPTWFCSLQETAAGGDEANQLTMEEVVGDSRASTALDNLLHSEDLDILREQFDRLPQREAQVLTLYYLEDLRLKEIAEVLGVTESRVSQIHTLAIERLRTAMDRRRRE
jgi:RNA polymerase sigma factor for flagellar operon FliA